MISGGVIACDAMCVALINWVSVVPVWRFYDIMVNASQKRRHLYSSNFTSWI